MKHKTVRKMMVLILVVFVLALFFFVLWKSAAYPYRNEKSYFQTEYFECVRRTEYSVTICGFTSKGLETEEIVIPDLIDNLPVVEIGWASLLKPVREHNFDKGAVKKIFIPEGIKIRVPKRISNIDKIIVPSIYYTKIDYMDLLTGTKYVPASKLTEYQELTESTICAANTSYYYNYPPSISYFYLYYEAPNGGYYWIDDVNEGDVIKTIPEPPSRSGYKFGGWYAEPECITPWDFKTKKTADKDFELYAKWENY
ncbi:MAG: InlB B-repeat-containing protein [Christensenellaceae bacterium]|nr:InlB B-repeat-containing protein [Christensenellaceae bacterium]